MIGFLNAAYLFGALAVAAPILLHLLRRRPREIEVFPSFRFLRATAAAKQNRNNIRKWIVLALRCAILLLLSIAFAWPYLPRFSETPRELTVLLWDDSFSMRAAPHEAELRQKARSILASATSGGPVAAGAVGERVEWSGDFTTRGDELAAWFDQRPPSWGTSRMKRALRLADRKLQSVASESKRLVVVTDRQLVPWQDVELKEMLSPGTKLEVITSAAAGFRNAAITETRVETPLVAEAQPLTLRVRVRNYDSRPMRGHLTALWLGSDRPPHQVELPPLSQKDFALTLESGPLEPQGGRVRLVVDDELAVDNDAWFAANPSRPPRVYLSAPPRTREEVDFVRAALTIGERGRAADVAPLDDADEPADFAEAAAVVLRDPPTAGSALDERLDEALRGGARVVAVWHDTPAMRQWLGRYGVNPASGSASGSGAATSGGGAGAGGDRRLGAIDFEHPVFAPFLKVRVGSMFHVLFFDPPALALPAHARVLARFDDGHPAVAEIDVDAGRLIVIASAIDRASTDWPLHAGFLPFWRELIGYTARGRGDATAFAVSSKPARLDDLRSVSRLDGEAMELENGGFVPREPGVYLVEGLGRSFAVSVNVPSEESDPLPLVEHFPFERLASSEVPQTVAAAGMRPVTEDRDQALWWFLLTGVLLLLLSEVALANRTAL